MPRLPAHLAAGPVGRERLSRETLTEHQRARILDAATGVFAKRGYAETTIDNIITAAKASVGSFYGLFENKEACFLAVYDRSIGQARAEVVAAAPWDRLGRANLLGLQRMLALFAARPLEARIILIEVQTAGPQATARYNALMDGMIEWLGRGRGQYGAAAELPASFEQAAVAGLAFLLQQRLLASEAIATESLFADTTQMVLEPIVGTAEIRRLRSELTAALPSG